MGFYDGPHRFQSVLDVKFQRRKTRFRKCRVLTSFSAVHKSRVLFGGERGRRNYVVVGGTSGVGPYDFCRDNRHRRSMWNEYD